MNKGQFRKGQVPWNKGMTTTVPRCSDCGQFLNEGHTCANVDKKGTRYCGTCGRQLKATPPERYSKHCNSCMRKSWRARERQLKKDLVKQFGGGCQKCGYSRFIQCLEFHHKNGKTENSRKKHIILHVVKEPWGFELFCNRCHREKHVLLQIQTKGGLNDQS